MINDSMFVDCSFEGVALVFIPKNDLSDIKFSSIYDITTKQLLNGFSKKEKTVV
jgi:hypothetical protein